MRLISEVYTEHAFSFNFIHVLCRELVMTINSTRKGCDLVGSLLEQGI